MWSPWAVDQEGGDGGKEGEREETGGKTWEGKITSGGKTEVEDKGDERQEWIMSRIREERNT